MWYQFGVKSYIYKEKIIQYIFNCKRVCYNFTFWIYEFIKTPWSTSLPCVVEHLIPFPYFLSPFSSQSYSISPRNSSMLLCNVLTTATSHNNHVCRSTTNLRKPFHYLIYFQLPLFDVVYFKLFSHMEYLSSKLNAPIGGPCHWGVVNGWV